MLSRSLHVAIPTAAPDAVLASIAEELKRNGCAIREVTPTSVAFCAPEPIASSWKRKGRHASMVSEGVVWLDGPASAPVRVEVRLEILQLAGPAIAAIGVVVADIHGAIRAIALVMISWVVWILVDLARAEIDDWVAAGIRKAG